MKKLITLLLVCVLACAIAVPCLAATGPTMSLAVSKTTANPGDTITVTASITETADCTAAGLVISYDTTAFEMVENSFVATVENLQASCKYNNIAKSYVVNIQFESAQKVSGELFTFKLKVKQSAPLNASYTISGTPSVRVNKAAVSSTMKGVSVSVACAHSYTSAVTKQPTCGEEGVKTFTCSGCGDSYTEAIAKTTDHKYGNWEKVNDTTHKKTCSVCKDVKTASHSWNSGVVTKQPTCAEEGVKTFTCSDCGHSYTEAIAKTTDHKYGSWEKVNDTTHKKTCSVCKKEQTASHTWNSGVVTKQPTCAEEGVKTFTCTGCGHTYTEPVAKPTHTYTSAVTKQPSCAEEGVKTFTCSGCGDSYTEAIAKTTDHKYGDWEKVDGNNHKRTCSVCKDEQTAAHTYTSTVTKQPTCTEEGEKTFTCSDCGDSYTETVEKVPHKYDHACDTDCNNCGETRTTEHVYSKHWTFDKDNHWHKCTVCNHIQEKLAHKPGPEATEETDQVCLDCGYVLNKALKHTHSVVGDWQKDETNHWHLCGCGEIMDQQAHTWDQGTLNSEGTEKTYACTVCGQTKTEQVQKPTEPPTTQKPTEPPTTTPQNSNQPDQDDVGFPWIVVVIVAVVVIAAAACVIFFVLKKKKQEE